MGIIKARFGPQSSEVEPAVMALIERSALEQVLKRLLKATSLTELLNEKV